MQVKSLSRLVELTQNTGSSKISRLIFIFDQATSIRFLADSGVQISIIPAIKADKQKKKNLVNLLFRPLISY